MDGGPSQVDTFDPKPLLDEVPRQAVPDEGRADAVQQRRQHARQPVEVQAVRPERAARQRPVPARRRSAPTTWPSSARWCRTSPSTRTPTTSCTRARPAGPAEHRLVGHLRPRQRVPGPAGVRRPRQRHDPARRRRLLRQRLPARVVPGVACSSTGAQPGRRTSRRPAATAPSAAAAKLDLLRKLDAPARERYGDSDAARVRHRQLRTGVPHADGRARTRRTSTKRDRRRRRSCTASTTRRRRCSAGSA